MSDLFPRVEEEFAKAERFESFLDKFHHRQFEIAFAALEENQLTEEMKFALCFAASVPMDIIDLNDGKLRIQTSYPCGIAKVGGKWTVFKQMAARKAES